MILALACLALTLIVGGGLSWSLWNGAVRPMTPRGVYDLGVYRAQIQDLDRDLERGLIDDGDAKLLRVEIERRILRIEQDGDHQAAPQKPRRLGLIAAIAAVSILVPAGLYALLGSPKVVDQPYAARASQIDEMQSKVAKIKAMVDQLAARLQDDPNDGKGWFMLGRSLRVLRQPDRAKTAFERAMALMPNDVQVRLELGSLLIEDLPAGTPLPDEFVTVMRDVLAIDPDVPDALYFVGLAEAEAGNVDKALALWTILLKKIPPESPDRAELQKQIDGLKK